MEEVNKKLKNFLINSSASGVELNCLPSFATARRQQLQDYLRYNYGAAVLPAGKRKYQVILAFLICAIARNHLNELANEDVNEPEAAAEAFLHNFQFAFSVHPRNAFAAAEGVPTAAGELQLLRWNS